MKTLKISIAVIALAFSSIGLSRRVSSSEQFATGLIEALSSTSMEQFEALLPTLDEFYSIMDENNEYYGEYLEDAKREFSNEYKRAIMPTILDSYNAVRQQAASQGISWSKVSYLRVSVDEGAPLENHTITIYFSIDGQVRRLVVEKAFKLKGQWKIADRIKMI